MLKSALRELVAETGYLAKLVAKTLLFLYAPIAGTLTALHYPYATDATRSTGRSSARFYESAYQRDSTKRGIDYERSAKAAAEQFGIVSMIRKFVAGHGLAQAKVLEVGSGRGYLQDAVADYTGLDLSPSVARHYHKPFVVGSATNMPFADNSFDALWTVWVMEHIPEPERALREMRRVVRPGGLLLLYVAWNCTSWAADGFDVRPYSDFNWRGKVVKATVPMRSLVWSSLLDGLPTRTLRWAHYGAYGSSEHLHFRRLEPNYDVYWEPDSDAAVSLDSFETYLWFRAAGDQCLNCGSTAGEMVSIRNPLIIKVGKALRN